MSIRAMTAVWMKSQHKNSALLLMLAIADCANDEGTAWPSLDYLAHKTRRTARAVDDSLDALIASGELTVERGAGPRGTNVYTIMGLDEEELAEVRANIPRKTREKSAKNPVIEPNKNLSKNSLNLCGDQKPHKRQVQTSPGSIRGAISDLCQWHPDLMSKAQHKRVSQVVDGLRSISVTSGEAIKAFGDWWYANDWRGKQQQPPTPEQILSGWKAFQIAHDKQATAAQASIDNRAAAKDVIRNARTYGEVQRERDVPDLRISDGNGGMRHTAESGRAGTERLAVGQDGRA